MPLDAWLDAASHLVESVTGATHALALAGAFAIVLTFVVIVMSWGDGR